MTQQKHFKQRVRARMAKTGERYAAARRQILGAAAFPDVALAPPAATALPPSGHYPGNVPATTALRTLLAHAGVRAPHTHQPFTEAMLFGIAGGVGIGVFAFFYEAEDTASFFVAGRHRWQDDLAYIDGASTLLGATTAVQEASGAGKAEAALRSTLGRGGPCIAWVDAAGLPHRAMPAAWSGGGYHVVTVHAIDDSAGTALIGDLSDDLVPIDLPALAAARGRIKKQKHRLLTLTAAANPPDLRALVFEGLRRCHRGLTGADGIGAKTNFSLEAIRVWATRMGSAKDKDRWERVFAPGHRFWHGLTSIHDFVEHYGTGGGLCRPLFADFLAEAGAALDDERLRGLGRRYAALGQAWSALADAALPDDVEALREAKAILARKAELLHGGGSREEIRAAWEDLARAEQAARAHFPLTDAECAALRGSLHERLVALYEGEIAAHEEMGELLEMS